MENLKSAAESAAQLGSETLERAKDIGRDAAETGYEYAREAATGGMEYVEEIASGFTDFARREPWIALAGAFVVGYVAARALRHLS